MISCTTRRTGPLRSSRAARAAAGSALAAALLLTGCTGSDDPADDAPTADATDPAQTPGADEGTDEPTEEPTSGMQATTGALVNGFPEAIQVLPDAEIVQSSAEADEDSDLVHANLTLRTDMSEDDVLEFYADTLDEAGYEPVSEPTEDDGLTRQQFHAEGATQAIMVSIQADADDDSQLQVFVGGTAPR